MPTSAPTDPNPCSCSHLGGSHLLSQHPDGGRCTGLDSYGLPCGCHSFELLEDA